MTTPREPSTHPRVTLRQVAAATGVSAMTVSRAFRQGAPVRPSLRERIIETARQMGYEPDPHISSVMRAFVRRGSPHYRETLAFIGDRKPAPATFNALTFQGALSRAEALGYHLEPFWMGEPHLTFSRLNRLLRTRSIRGVLFCPFDLRPRMHVRLDWSRLAVGALGSSLWKPRLNRVQHHHYMGMILALRSIHRLVGDKAGLVLSNLLHTRSQGAYVSSFLTNQADSPRDVLGRIHRYGAWQRERFLAWLERADPEILLCAEPNDVRLAREAIRGRARWRHLGIACLDVSESTPDLAGISQQNTIIGSHAVDLILSEIQHAEFGLPTYPKTLMIEGAWKDGPSLRAC